MMRNDLLLRQLQVEIVGAAARGTHGPQQQLWLMLLLAPLLLLPRL